MKIQIHKIIYDTTAEGFGRRTCIWVQGCSRKCPGCMAPHTWDAQAGIEMDTDDIIAELRKCKGQEGITLLGGEPFEQAKPLAVIACAARKMGLSVVAFSGYTLEELQHSDHYAVKELLGQTDLLIDGPYIREKRDLQRPWVGSANQKFHFLTDRYNEEMLKKQNNKLEIRIFPDGRIQINGMTDFEKTMEEKEDAL